MIERFEADFASYAGIPHTVALASGTAAIHLALKLLGLSPGDHIWASTLTFIGSVAAVAYEGLTPVFVDAEPSSWTIDVQLLEDSLKRAATAGTLPKAIIPTDLYGQPCDMDALLEMSRRWEIPIVCDSAEAVGAFYRGRHAGSCAFAAAFSFNGNKIITTSGGGMLASHDSALIDRARWLSTQARESQPHYEHRQVGYNYRLSNICAAIGVAQLEVLDDRVARRRAIFDRYQAELGDMPGLTFMPEAQNRRSNRWLTVLQLDPDRFGATCHQVRAALESVNIEARPVWKPMHLQPVFRGTQKIGGEVSENLFARGLCLPSGTQMTDADIRQVATIIKECARV
jgi:dTDP-4-amino-4,6-dideoxygalactose transaminase